MNNKKSIFYLINIPSPYRVDFINKLSVFYNLTLFVERENSNDRNLLWFKKNEIRVNTILLKGIKIGSEGLISFSVIKHLFTKTYEIYVVGGYSTVSSILAILTLRLMKKNFFINIDGYELSQKKKKIRNLIKKLLLKSAHISFLVPSITSWSNLNKDIDLSRSNYYLYRFSSLNKNDLDSPLIYKKFHELSTYKINKKRLRIVYFGRLLRTKGIKEIIVLSNELTSVDFTIIGGDCSSLTKYYDELNISQPKNLRILPFMEKSELLDKLLEFDVFYFPTYNDVWGLVIIEAMSRGLVIVSSRKSGAANEIIEEHENGYTIDFKSGNLGKEEILYLEKNRKLLFQMGLNNIIKSKEFTIENMVADHLTVFNKGS